MMSVLMHDRYIVPAGPLSCDSCQRERLSFGLVGLGLSRVGFRLLNPLNYASYVGLGCPKLDLDCLILLITPHICPYPLNLDRLIRSPLFAYIRGVHGHIRAYMRGARPYMCIYEAYTGIHDEYMGTLDTLAYMMCIRAYMCMYEAYTGIYEAYTPVHVHI